MIDLLLDQNFVDHRNEDGVFLAELNLDIKDEKKNILLIRHYILAVLQKKILIFC